MKNVIFLILILISAVYLRSYTISAGLPYFYDEDEAHHFNRTVNMAKSGDMNPHYFNKPSLHFYLRIPIVLLSTYWSKTKGYLKDIGEIRTYNKFGIADYAFTASHPGIVKWNRSLSLLFSIIIIILTFIIGKIACNSAFVGLFAAAGTAISPSLIAYSGVIGVDTLMTMMCLFAVYFSLRFTDKGTIRDLILGSFFAGLAVSSKYNALPVCAVPFTAALFSKSLNKKTFIICAAMPIAAFFLASPFILISLPLFIKNLSYEIWHYSTAGHVGHSAEPGLQQMLFYFNWFYSEAMGSIFSVAALLGFLLLILGRKKTTYVFLAFPILYFLMMVMQKTNFTRNMLVILPFLFISSVYGIHRTLNYLNIRKVNLSIFALFFFLLASIQPLRLYSKNKNEILSRPESRREFTDWVFNEDKSTSQTAIAGIIQAVPQIPLGLKNYTTVDTDTENVYSLWLKGYDRVVLSNPDTSRFPPDQMSLIKTFAGLKENKRIIENPRIEIYEISLDKLNPEKLMEELEKCAECKISCEKSGEVYDCSRNQSTSEGYQWLNRRLVVLDIPELKSEALSYINLELMSPWKNEIGIYPLLESPSQIPAGNWDNYSLKFDYSVHNFSKGIALYTKTILSPFKEGRNSDARRLGIAIKLYKLQPR